MWQTCLKMYVCKLEELESLGMGLQWAWACDRHGFDFLPTWSNCYRVELFCCLSNQTPRGGRPCRCQEFHDFSCGFCFWILSFAKLLYRTAGAEEVVSKWRSWRWVCLNIGGHPEFWWLMKRCLIMFPNYSTGHHIGTYWDYAATPILDKPKTASHRDSYSISSRSIETVVKVPSLTVFAVARLLWFG